MTDRLAHRWIGAADAPRAAFILHGILGSGRNWEGFARRWVAAAPAWRLCLVDLRNHGESKGFMPPQTLEALADDLGELAATVGGPEWVVGHSYGGKVALHYARAYAGAPLSRVWSLDSTPGASAGGGGEVERVIEAVGAAPQPVPDRATLRDWFRAQGFSPMLAGWMTTNLRQTPEGLVWRFDVAGIAAMLADFRARDAWDVLESPPAGVHVHLVRAGQSDRWTPDVLHRLAASQAEVSVLPGAGHWLHVDDPDGLLNRLLDPHGR